MDNAEEILHPGYIRNDEQINDPRNLSYGDIAAGVEVAIPETIDVEQGDWTLDQGSIPACTAFSLVKEAEQILGGVRLSPRYAYGRIKTDPAYPSSRLPYGAYLLDGLKLLINEGIVSYGTINEDVRMVERDYINVAKENGQSLTKGGNYAFVTGKTDEEKFDAIVHYMAMNNKPVRAGIDWHGAYNNAPNGVVPPLWPSGSPVGHAVVFVAAKVINGIQYIGLRNSFGPNFGDHGRTWFPRGFVTIHEAEVYIKPALVNPMPQYPDVRNIDLEKSCAKTLRTVLYQTYPLNVAPVDGVKNEVARSLAGRMWFELYSAIAYRGFTVTDVMNFLWARTRNLTTEKAYSLDFTRPRSEQLV